MLPCEGLIAKLACFACPIQTLHRNSPHTPGPEYNPPFVQPEQPVQDLASQRRTNTFRRLLFGFCNWHWPSLPACVMKGSCPSVGRTGLSLVQLPHLQVLQLRKFQVPETNLGSVRLPLREGFNNPNHGNFPLRGGGGG